MAAGITSSDSMMSVREMPWHGLGRVIDEYPGTIEEALKLSGLDWTVVQEPVSIPVRTEVAGQTLETFQRIPNTYANVRSDTNDVLGLVTARYKPIQNVESFDFLDNLIGNDAKFETAGSLYGGKRVWVLIQLPDYIEVGGDKVAQYIFISNSHDGKSTAVVAVTPVRIVCANTLSFALRSMNASRTMRIHHTGDIAEKIHEARKVMDLTINYYEKFKLVGDRLATERLSLKMFERKVVAPLFPIEDGMTDRIIGNRQAAREALMGLYEGKGYYGDTTGNAPGTKWCAANAVGEYADFYRRITTRGSQMANSFDGGTLKQQGLDLVMAA